MAPRQAGFRVLGGSKEGAKIDVGGIEYFLAEDNNEGEATIKPRLCELSGPEPGETVNARNGAGERVMSPHVGPESGVTMLCVVHGDFPTW